MAAKNAVAKNWTITPSADGKRWSGWPAGDKPCLLKWNSVAGATGYSIKWGTTAGSYPNSVSVGNVTQYLIGSLGLPKDTTVYVVCVATNASGSSGNSSALTVKNEALNA